MKKFVVASLVTLSSVVLSSVGSIAFADVIWGPSGQPVAVSSNPGSLQGQANRSATGTQNKFTHDGVKPIIPVD